MMDSSPPLCTRLSTRRTQSFRFKIVSPCSAIRVWGDAGMFVLTSRDIGGVGRRVVKAATVVKGSAAGGQRARNGSYNAARPHHQRVV